MLPNLSKQKKLLERSIELAVDKIMCFKISSGCFLNLKFKDLRNLLNLLHDFDFEKRPDF